MKFNTRIQQLKHLAMREVATALFSGRDIRTISEASNERINMALGGDRSNPNVIQVIENICNRCPADGFYVTEICRGCNAKHCAVACKFGAISFNEKGKAVIDKTKCVNCGMCAKACKYGSIVNRVRPCEVACKVQAITAKNGEVIKVLNDKCIACGSCVANCPFGAVVDTSSIVDVIKLIKEREKTKGFNLYAMIAPSIAGQFENASVGQIAKGLKVLGFSNIIETALGADMVSMDEARELAEKGFLLSSCCPSFVEYVKKNFPEFEKNISRNLSPMGTLGKHIKEKDKTSKIVFIGPCTAKKMEIKKPELNGVIDIAITFEELSALFSAKKIVPQELKAEKLENATYFGRRFARNCGLSEAVAQSLKEQNIDFQVKPILGNGIAGCKAVLLKAKAGQLDANFIEGMACEGGCVGGPCCISKNPNQPNANNYFDTSEMKSIKQSTAQKLKGFQKSNKKTE